jgi:hypothetical protein
MAAHASAQAESHPQVAGRPVVVELVGVAAAGKSSLLRALLRRDPAVQSMPTPSRRRHLAAALSLTPTFASLHWPFHRLGWKQMKRMTYLQTLDHMLHQGGKPSAAAVVLDEGPCYMLARLRVYGGERILGARFERWWHVEIERWARTLDLVVWLDAPDPVLLQRVRARMQAHRLQRLSEHDARRFLASYRSAYDLIADGLDRAGGLRVLRVRSDRESLNQLADRLTTELIGWTPEA